MRAPRKPNNATLANIQRMYDHIALNPGASMVDLCMHFGAAASTLRHSIALLRDSGHIVKHDGARRFQGQAPASYFVTSLPRPTTVAPSLPRSRLPMRVVDAMVKRKFVAAKQIGIARDPLVAALFGAGQVAHV